MNIKFLEQDNDDIACISCTHRYNKSYSSFCDVDEHYIFYANLWCQTCDKHELIDILGDKKFIDPPAISEVISGKKN